MITDLVHRVRRYADAHADRDGVAVLPVEGVAAMRSYAPAGFVKSIYRPLICLVLQGAKQALAGADTYEFAAGTSALITAHLPVVSRITQASRAEPYVALAVELDITILLDLAGLVPGQAGLGAAVRVDDTDPAVADCALRLMSLLERPDAIPVLRPSIMRELHYWLLQGPHGAAISGLARPGGVAHRVAQAIAVLRSEFDRKLQVEHLASVAGMSPSTFHHHFRAMTSLSPIQFQKQIRLQEARSRLLAEPDDVAGAGFAVGYESASHFNREYRRMFGTAPGRDARALRDALTPIPSWLTGSRSCCLTG